MKITVCESAFDSRLLYCILKKFTKGQIQDFLETFIKLNEVDIYKSLYILRVAVQDYQHNTNVKNVHYDGNSNNVHVRQ